MKRYMNRTMVIVMGVIVVIVLITGLSILSSRSQKLPQQEDAYSTWLITPTRPPWCVPLPPKKTRSGHPPTPTLDPFYVTPVQHFTQLIQPTVTPYVVAHNFDLAPDLPPKEKNYALVFRCNGEIDRYYYGLMTYPDLIAATNLGEGDVILDTYSNNIYMGPPIRTVLTPTPTEPPYSSPTPYP